MIYIAFLSFVDLAFRDESPNYKEKFTSNSYKLNIIDICLRQVLKFTVIQKKNLSFNIHVTFIIYLLTYVLIHNKTNFFNTKQKVFN